MSRVSVIFTLESEAEFPPEAQAQFRRLTGEWIPLNRSGNIRLYDAVVAPEQILVLAEMMAGMNPTILGVWNRDGSYFDPAAYPFQTAAYLAAMPDIVEFGGEGNETSRRRPTEPGMLHQWGGWEAKIFA